MSRKLPAVLLLTMAIAAAAFVAPTAAQVGVDAKLPSYKPVEGVSAASRASGRTP